MAEHQPDPFVAVVIPLRAIAVPDHSTLSRRAKTLEVPRPQPRRSGEPLHLLVDSTGLRLCGAGEWLQEKHGTKVRRSWRKLHIGLDAGSGQIVAASLTAKEVDDGAEVGSLLDQVTGTVSSLTADGGYDQDRVYAGVAERHPEAAVVVPPRATAVPSDTAETAPTQRDRHMQHIAEHGRMAWPRPQSNKLTMPSEWPGFGPPYTLRPQIWCLGWRRASGGHVLGVVCSWNHGGIAHASI